MKLTLRNVLTLCIIALMSACGTSEKEEAKECQKFRYGKYKMTGKDGAEYIFERKGNIQTEYDVQKDIKFEFTIKWADKCSYHLIFKRVLENPNDHELPADWPRVIVKILEVKENSYVQESSIEGVEDFVKKNEVYRLD